MSTHAFAFQATLTNPSPFFVSLAHPHTRIPTAPPRLAVRLIAMERIEAGTEIRFDYDLGCVGHPFRDIMIAVGVAEENLSSDAYKQTTWDLPEEQVTSIAAARLQECLRQMHDVWVDARVPLDGHEVSHVIVEGLDGWRDGRPFEMSDVDSPGTKRVVDHVVAFVDFDDTQVDWSEQMRGLCLLAMHSEREASLLSVYVRPDARGGGLVDALLGAATSYLRDHGISATLPLHSCFQKVNTSERFRDAFRRAGWDLRVAGDAWVVELQLGPRGRRSTASGSGSKLPSRRVDVHKLDFGDYPRVDATPAAAAAATRDGALAATGAPPPALENAALVADGSSPPDSHVGGESLGSGGCVAVALSKLKLFASAATAKQALNTQLATYSAKCRPDYRVPEHVGVADDHWHPEVVKMAVVEANFHFHKLDLDSVDLATELRGGSFLVDGVLNDSFVQLVNGKAMAYDTDPADQSSPPDNEAGWRHAIAVSHGRILEKEFEMSAQWLWLDDANKPDPLQGYLFKVLKVYRIFRCTSHHAGCKGRCAHGTGPPFKRRRRGKTP